MVKQCWNCNDHHVEKLWNTDLDQSGSSQAFLCEAYVHAFNAYWSGIWKATMCTFSFIPRKVRISHNLWVPETTSIGLNHIKPALCTWQFNMWTVPCPFVTTRCHSLSRPPRYVTSPSVAVAIYPTLMPIWVNQKWMSEIWTDCRHCSDKSNKLSACFTEIISSTGRTEGKPNLLKMLCDSKTQILVFYLWLPVNSVLFLSLKSSQQLRIYFK